MMLVSQGRCVRYLADKPEATGYWSGTQNPRLGSHFGTPRRGYLRYGIHVGARQVVHYSGLAHVLRRGPMEEVPFAHCLVQQGMNLAIAKCRKARSCTARRTARISLVIAIAPNVRRARSRRAILKLPLVLPSRIQR
jgi:hypothetical protein